MRNLMKKNYVMRRWSFIRSLYTSIYPVISHSLTHWLMEFYTNCALTKNGGSLIDLRDRPFDMAILNQLLCLYWRRSKRMWVEFNSIWSMLLFQCNTVEVSSFMMSLICISKAQLPENFDWAALNSARQSLRRASLLLTVIGVSTSYKTYF